MAAVFTGHITEIGVVTRAGDAHVQVQAARSLAGLTHGGSVCVSGVRLTVAELGEAEFAAALTPETRRRSTLGTLTAGHPVNLELPLMLGDALNGHLVQGYVEAVGKVARVEPEGECLRIWIRPPERLMPRLVAKAPIALDGVSVTVADRLRDRFSVVVLPVTRRATTLDRLAAGDRVNLELDLVDRLVARRGQAARDDLPLVAAALATAAPATAALATGASAGSGAAGNRSGRAAVDQAVAAIAAGGAVAVWDPDAENEGDVIFGGASLRPAAFRFLLTEVCGHPTVPCAPEVLDRLEIGPVPGPGDRHGTAFAVPVDLAAGTGTGVSAAERAAVVRRLANPSAVPSDFLRPGHVHPLRARPGLLAERAGHTEATVALCLAAGLPPVGVCCELMNRDGTMASAADFEVAALRWSLPLVAIADLRAWL